LLGLFNFLETVGALQFVSGQGMLSFSIDLEYCQATMRSVCYAPFLALPVAVPPRRKISGLHPLFLALPGIGSAILTSSSAIWHTVEVGHSFIT
jgi:hypothetical protein